MHALIVAVEKFSIEKLDSNHGEDELEEGVDDQDVEHILQRDYHTIKNSLQLGNPEFGELREIFILQQCNC